MAFTFIVKNTSTAGKEPTAGQIERGELALNLVDHKLYSKGVNDEIFEIGEAGETPSGGTDERPSGPSLGDLYFDTDLDVLLYWDGNEWVPVGQEAIGLDDLTDVEIPDGSLENGQILIYDENSGLWSNATLEIPPGTLISETAPDSPEAGQLWWADTDVEEGGGRLYIYTGTEWVDTSLPGAGSGGGEGLDETQADLRYLRIDADATDQTRVAGEVTFSETTHHQTVDARTVENEQGVLTVSGNGKVQVRTQDVNLEPKTGLLDVNVTITGTQTNSSTDTHPCGTRSEIYTDENFDDTTEAFICAYQSRVVANAAKTGGHYIHYYAPPKRASAAEVTEVVGFRTGISSTDASKAYGFYASGNARNLFKGSVSVFQNDLAPNYNNTAGVGWKFNPDGMCEHAYHSTNGAQSAFWINRTGSTTGNLMVFNYAPNSGDGGTTQAGSIKFTSANSINFNPGASDYRLKENIVDLPDALERVKAIKPYQYNFKNEPGVVHEGFLAHELAEHSVLAVSGEKDATEVFGTYTDPDGNVEANVSEPETLPYGATFEPQGTREVYQSVAPMALIPLLTKALQETIAKNEELEARIAALEGA